MSVINALGSLEKNYFLIFKPISEEIILILAFYYNEKSNQSNE